MRKNKLKQKSVTIEFCHGSNEGTAIYLNENDADGTGSGYRIAGPKCWGFIKAEKVFTLTREDLLQIIEKAKQGIQFLDSAKLQGEKK